MLLDTVTVFNGVCALNGSNTGFDDVLVVVVVDLVVFIVVVEGVVVSEVDVTFVAVLACPITYTCIQCTSID